MKCFHSTAAMALLLGSLSLLGQGDRGAITGVITDTSGSAVPGVAIEVVNNGTNLRFDTLSTSTGAYRLVGLPVGIYDLTAKASGFSTLSRGAFRFRLTRPRLSTFRLRSERLPRA